MPTIRALRPTDLMLLIGFFRNDFHREVTAQVWPELQGQSGTRIMKELYRQLVSGPGGHSQAWLSVSGGRIRGLAIAGPRAGKLLWDVRNLFVVESEAQVGVELLELATAEVAKRGARRVFLSTPSDGETSRLARQSGFVQYTSEALYGIKLPAAISPGGYRPARPRLRHDTHALFSLYNAAVPSKVRFSEAATLEEWICLERAGRPWEPRLGGTNQHYVWDERGELAGWLQITFGARSQHLSLLVHPAHANATEEMLQYSLSQASHKAPIYVSARDYQVDLASALERLGFGLAAEYRVFARELTARVPIRPLVPARA